MKKEIRHIEFYCDNCGEKVDTLFGSDGREITVDLSHTWSGKPEKSVKLIPYFQLDHTRSGSICATCFHTVLLEAIKQFEK